jgi:hypothetical protein
MSKKYLQAGDKEGFLRAFTDMWSDTEADHECLISFSIGLTKQKGVLELRMAAWSEAERRGGYPKARYVCSYPTAAVATFEAALYQAITRLERILDQQRKYPEGKA